MNGWKSDYAKHMVLIVAGMLLTVPGYAVQKGVQKTVQGTQGYRDEINRPPEPWKGPPRTGEQVYAYRCAGCHAKTTQGAPMPNDTFEWSRRASQGMKVLMEHTIKGYKQELMPPRGGCENCSDAELKAEVMFFLEQSGVRPKRTGKL